MTPPRSFIGCGLLEWTLGLLTETSQTQQSVFLLLLELLHATRLTHLLAVLFQPSTLSLPVSLSLTLSFSVSLPLSVSISLPLSL